MLRVPAMAARTRRGAKVRPRPGTKDDWEIGIACRFARVKPLAQLPKAKTPLRKCEPKARHFTYPAVRLQRGAILSACARAFARLMVRANAHARRSEVRGGDLRPTRLCRRATSNGTL